MESADEDGEDKEAMNIKLDPSDSSEFRPVSAATSARVERTPVVESTHSELSAGDTAEISEVAGLMAEAKEQPDLRMEKVASIKAQIEAGNYKVDADKVADAMIDALMKGRK